MDLSIIIVNWNSADYLRRCLTSIRQQTTQLTYEIIVVDSGSFDGCAEMLRDEFPAARFLQLKTNVGFARANNLGFAQSIGDFVVFLNPDTEVVGPALAVLHSAASVLANAGLIGCKLLNSDGSLQRSCVQSIPTITNQVLDSTLLRTVWPTSALWGASALHQVGNSAQEVHAISGACLMLRRTTFERLGRFTEDYFMYAEDIDICYRARLAGYANYYVPSVTVTHHGGSSSDQSGNVFSSVMMREAIWRFLRKTRGPAYGLAYRVAMLASAVGRLIILRLAGLVRGRNAVTQASCEKWFAILQWTVRRDDIVRRYYPRAGHTQTSHPV